MTSRLVLLERKVPETRLTAALQELERVNPLAVEVIRGELNRLHADVNDLTAGRLDVYLGRMLAEGTTRLASVAIEMNNASREWRTLVDRVLPILDRTVSSEVVGQTEITERARVDIAQLQADVEAKRLEVERMRLEVDRMKSRDRVLVAALPLAMLVGSFLTWLLSGGQFPGGS